MGIFGNGWKGLHRGLCLLLVLCALMGLLSGCAGPGEKPRGLDGEGYVLRAAVLHAGGDRARDLYDLLEQSLLLNLEVTLLEAGPETDLAPYDLLYLDTGLLNGDWETQTLPRLLSYTEQGGAVFLTNDFFPALPLDYLGAKRLVPVTEYPAQLKTPELGRELRDLQGILRDFAGIFPEYFDFDILSQMELGYAIKPDGALSLASHKGKSLYSLNRYGEGCVFAANALLPNFVSMGNLSMATRAETMGRFACTTAAFNQLILSGFAAFVAREKYGYALERVFGYFGAPSMAWEVHYGENINSVSSDALGIFSRLCQEALQVPSFTLVRSAYDWFCRYESVSYVLGSVDGFAMDPLENAYSSGTHVLRGDKWLCRGKRQADSYFSDYQNNYWNRACVAMGDCSGDGIPDLLFGGQTGGIFCYEGLGFVNGRFAVRDPIALPAGSACSAPELGDVDGDGILDLLMSDDYGNVFWCKGYGDLYFAEQQLLLESAYRGQAIPRLGDWDGDGVSDLLLGSNKGILMLYYGSRGGDGLLRFDPLNATHLSRLCADAELGSWLAPAPVDWDGDGALDFALGTADGYIALFLQQEGAFVFQGYLEETELNYKGNARLKFGTFAVPSFGDLNGDGVRDLLCGNQEYGMAYAADSPYYPCREALQAQMDYAMARDYYIGLHFYTHAYASPEKERRELAAQKALMASLGLPLERIGANQHTWYTSSLSDTQTMDSLFEAGLLWQSGFSSPGSKNNTPQTAAENALAYPFFLQKDGEDSILIQGNSVLHYAPEAWTALSARYRMPVCLYFHCEFIEESDAGARAGIQSAGDFQRRYGYNFNREDQLMLASAAAYHQAVSTRAGPEGELILQPRVTDTDFPLYDEAVQNSLGLRISFAGDAGPENISTDADVWYWDGDCLVLGLNRSVSIRMEASAKPPHLARVNMAAELSSSPTGAEIQFRSGGMMQAVVAGDASTQSPGWTVTREDGQTVFTKFGTGERLSIDY